MIENGLYKITDKYFEDFPHEKHIYNKDGRPFYYAGAFLFNNQHYIVQDKKLIRDVSVKSRNYIKQLELGKMYSQIDALKIREALIERMERDRSIKGSGLASR